MSLPGAHLTTEFAGNHTHAAPAAWYDRALLGDVAAASKQHFNAIDRGGPSVRDVRTSTDGNHNHAFTLGASTLESTASTGNNRPKWYALCFNMKL